MSLLTKFGTIPSQGGELWLDGWSYGKKITIPEAKVDAELTNFPLTVYLNNTNFDFSKAKADGSDIRFTDKNLNQLTFERKEHTYVVGGMSYATYNVKIPTISATTNTEVYMWYGNAGAYNTSVEAWRDMTGKALTYNGNVKVVRNSDTDHYASFDGTGDYFSLADSEDWNYGTSDFCLESKVKFSALPTTGTYMDIYCQDGTNYLIIRNTAGVYSLEWSGGTPTFSRTITLVTGVEYKIKVLRIGTTFKMLLDDIQIGTDYTSSSATGNPSTLYYIGAYGGTSAYMNGNIYGMRITKGRSRSADTMPTTFTIDGSDVVLCTNFDTIYDSNYVMVQHMGDSLVDATGNGNNGTATGTTVVNTDYGKARSFNGTSDSIGIGYPVIPTTSPITAMVMINTSAITDGMLLSTGNLSTNYGFSLAKTAGGKFEGYVSKGTNGVYSTLLTGTADVKDANTHIGVFVWNGTTGSNSAKLTTDDANAIIGTPLTQLTSNSYNLVLGKTPSGTAYYYTGIYSAVRISNIARSDAWIKAESLSLKDNLLVIENIAEKLADIEVTVATTSINITGLNLGKGDEVMLVCNLVEGSGTTGAYKIFVNNNLTSTDYYCHLLRASSTSVTSSRSNNAYVGAIWGNNKNLADVNIKLTNSGYFIWQASGENCYGGVDTQIETYYGTTTFTLTSITQLTLLTTIANGIGIGSRFQLYRYGRGI